MSGFIEDVQVALSLNTRGVKDGSDAAKAELDKLRKQIAGDVKELHAMGQALKRLGGDAKNPTKEYQALVDKMTSRKAEIADTQSKILGLGGGFRDTGRETKGFADRLKAFGDTASGLPGPLGGLVGSVQRFSQFVGDNKTLLGVAALTAGIVGLGYAAGKAISSLVGLGIANSSAREKELLHLEGITTIRNAWGIAAGTGRELQDAIDQVSAGVALGRDKVAGYAETLYRAGLRGNNLKQALEGTALTASVQGDAMAGIFAGTASHLNHLGGSVEKFTNTAKNRLGGIAQRQMRGLEVQSQKTAEAVAALTGGIDLTQFEEARLKFTNFFAANTASGKALKMLFGQIVQPIIDAATAAIPKIERFFLYLTLGALELEQTYLDLKLALIDAFLNSRALQAIDSMIEAFKDAGGYSEAMKMAVGIAIAVIAPLLWTGAVAAWSLASALVTAAASAALLAAPFVLAGIALYELYTIYEELVELFSTSDWSDIGRAIVMGIKEGLTAAWTTLKEAVVGLANSAKDAFKHVLGISSPSKVFSELGISITDGLNHGLDRGQADVDERVAALVPVPQLPELPEGRGSTTSVSTSNTNAGLTWTGDLVINTDAKTSQAMMPDVKQAFLAMLRECQLQQGAASG